MAARKRGKQLTVCEAISAIFNDSDSESEPEIDDIDIDVVEDDVANELQELFVQVQEHDQQVNRACDLPENVNNDFQWEFSGFDDPYEMD